MSTLAISAGFSAREKLMLAALMGPIAMELIDSGMLAVALPRIQADFGVPVDLLSWVVAAGFLPRVALMPIYGRVGDMLGKKRMYVVGLTIHTVGALLGIFAPSFAWLVVGRLLQGVGGSSLPLSMALIADAFPSERRGRALGLWNSAAPGGIIVGPVIGGLIVEAFGWHSIFVFVALGSLAALIAVARLIPERDPDRAGAKFDWIGAASLVLAAAALLLATTTQSLFPFGSPANWGFWTASALALAGMFWNAANKPNPLVGADVFVNRRFITPSVAVNLRMFAHDGGRFLLALYLANAFSQSPSSIGLLMLFYAVPLMIGVAFGGYLADHWTSRGAGVAGMAGQAAGLLWIGLAGTGSGSFALAPGMIVAGLCSGASLTPFTKEAVISLGQTRVGLASGLYNMVRFAGSAAAAPLLGLLLARGFAQAGGSESASAPYQLGFQLLAGVAALGIAAAALIPPPTAGSNVHD